MSLYILNKAEHFEEKLVVIYIPLVNSKSFVFFLVDRVISIAKVMQQWIWNSAVNGGWEGYTFPEFAWTDWEKQRKFLVRNSNRIPPKYNSDVIPLS
jgi:hypothetical protein